MKLNVEQLEKSFSKIQPLADEFAASFYSKLFVEYPQVKPLFANSQMGQQKQKLVTSLAMAIENLRQPEILANSLQELGSRHEKYGVTAEHYPLVGKTLLKTLEFYLGEDWTPEVKQAWTDAFHAITQLMLPKVEDGNREKSYDFDRVNAAISPLRERLLDHKVYGMLTDIRAIRIFMEHHCYAVWDFMCLLKCLQQKVTCVSVPWNISENIIAARMINEIVIAEETDVRRQGKGYASHLELYLDGMKEIGASTQTITRFCNIIAEGTYWQTALERAKVPSAVVPFISETLSICQEHPTYEVAAFFVFGRENIIPDMFRKIVEEAAGKNKINIDAFIYYLERHIGIDEDEHGPASIEMMRSLCGEDDTKWQLVELAAREALQARINLWDGIAAAITQLN